MPKAKKTVEVMQEDEVKTDLEKRRLFHEFNEEDLNALNEKIAELTEKKEKFADESKTMASIAKGAENEIKKALKDKAEGGEEREMMCPVIINYTKGTRTVKHPETGIVIEERPLNTEERQQDLFAGGQTENENPADLEEGADALLDEAHEEELGDPDQFNPDAE